MLASKAELVFTEDLRLAAFKMGGDWEEKQRDSCLGFSSQIREFVNTCSPFYHE